MLYIFHVDLGCTITVDINMTTKTVAELKERIEIETNIQPQHQILLMSGGDCLKEQATVGSYSTGTTDSNPIFLFNIAQIQNPVPPAAVTNYIHDDNLDKRFAESLLLPVSFSTLQSRTELATRCCNLSREQVRACERLVHDQHLQQQGWAAVLANFDDVSKYHEEKIVNFLANFTSFIQEREAYVEIYRNINTDLELLSKIPILPALRAYAEGFLSPEEYEQKLRESATYMTTGQEDLTNRMANLLLWVIMRDKSTLDKLLGEASVSLQQLDDSALEHLKNEYHAAATMCKRQDKREISGLSERLFQLEQVVDQAKKIMSEQAELAEGFRHNMLRVSNLRDDSVLPDLCLSHKNQLNVMLGNYKLLCDLRRRCTKAKEELSASIHRHLKWITDMENRLSENLRAIVLYNAKIAKARKTLDILGQIHTCPEMYMNAVAEVVRRRTFSEAFLSWAGNLAFEIMSVHREEIQRRQEFKKKFQGHFLGNLFPGLDDEPPPFATEAPAPFDVGLPKLTVEDMDHMTQIVPNLAASVSMPDLNSITQFFSSKSLTGSGVSDGEKEKESNLMVVDDTMVSSATKEVRAPTLSDRGDFGSETDTEEFEKIGQAAMDSKQTSYDSMKQQVQEDNQRKQLEVGASISTTSTSTNMSLLNRSQSSSSSELCQFPSFSALEKPPQQQQLLSPLTECVEYTSTSPTNHSSSPHFPLNSTVSSCDGSNSRKQRRLSGSDGSSPSLGNAIAATDFLGTEFYMDESLPSSLSEHPTDSQHQAIVSLLQESLNSSREEVERLRTIIRAFGNVTGDTVQEMRRELYEIKEQTLNERTSVSNVTKELNMMLKMQSQAVQEHEQKITVDNELKLAELKEMIQEKNKQIETMKNSLLAIENTVSEQEQMVISMRKNMKDANRDLHNYYMVELEKLENEKAMDTSFENNMMQDAAKEYEIRIKKLENQLTTTRINYEKELKEKCDQLHQEHKTEIETVRSRFKLMAASTMERSPSDSSLEKIERPDMIELTNHETILEQVKKDMERQRDEAICKISKQLQAAYDTIKKNEKCIDSMRSERVALFKNYQDLHYKNEYLKNSEALINSLSLENAKLKSELVSCKFVNYRESGKGRDSLVRQLSDDQMKMSLEQVEQDVEEVVGSIKAVTKKVKLEKELSASVLVVSDSSPVRIDVATYTEEAPITKYSLREKKISSRGRATLATCNCGDIVAIVWDPSHENYIILQDSETKYFLNSDSLAALGLKIGRSGSPTWAFGEVVEKEFCKAKKAENRYKVSMEEKFYRVKVKPHKKKDKDTEDKDKLEKRRTKEKKEEKPSTGTSTEPNQT